VASLLFIFIPGTIYKIGPSFIASSVGSNGGADWSTTKHLTINSFKNNLLLGPGPNLFVKNYWSHRPDAINSTVFWNSAPYNAVGAIQTLMASTGVIGLIAWLVFIISIIVVGIKTVFSAKGEIKWFRLFSGISVLYVSIVMINYPVSVFLLVFSIFLVALYLSTRNLDGNSSHNIGSGAMGKTFSIALSVFLLVSVAVYVYGISVRVLAQNKIIDAAKLVTDNKIDEAELKLLEAAKSTDLDYFYKSLFSLEVGKVNNLLSNAPEDAADNKEWNDKLAAAFQNAVLSGNGMVASFPDNSTNLLTLANFYSDSASIKVPGAYDKAKEVYTSLINSNPNDPTPYYFLAKLDFNNGNTDSALASLNKAVELKPEVVDFNLALADVYISKKDFDKAIEVITNGIQKIAPAESQMLYDKLSLVLFGTKQYAKAIPVFSRILQLPPQVQNYSYANVKYYLGLSLIKTGDYDNALLIFNDIKSTNQDNTELDRIIASVKAKRDPFPDFVPEVKQTATTTKSAAPTKKK
jgi:tetratricopeptide (TPR) repeat protein